MAAYDRSEFALEREKLIGEIAEVRQRFPSPSYLHFRRLLFANAWSASTGNPAQNLARCVSNVNQLNRNIENVALVGTGFHQVNMLWKQFENTMSETAPSIVGHPCCPEPCLAHGLQ